MAEYYLLLKTLHILAVISWMAGLLYLPRLFVYHAQVPVGDARDVMLQTMERKLYRYIMRPAMWASWLFGGLLLATRVPGVGPWLHIKLTAVVLLTGVHHMCGAQLRRFAAGVNTRSHVYFRWLNEVPTVLMVVIVAAVVYKP